MAAANFLWMAWQLLGLRIGKDSRAYRPLGCLALSLFSSALGMVFGQQLDRVLQRAGLECFLGAILAALMIVAVALFLL